FETVARKGARPPQDDGSVCCGAVLLGAGRAKGALRRESVLRAPLRPGPAHVVPFRPVAIEQVVGHGAPRRREVGAKPARGPRGGQAKGGCDHGGLPATGEGRRAPLPIAGSRRRARANVKPFTCSARTARRGCRSRLL